MNRGLIGAALCAVASGAAFAGAPLKLNVLNAGPTKKALPNLSSIRSEVIATGASKATGSLPLWTYDVISPRDGGEYTGLVVGADPFNRAHARKNTQVATFVVPIIIQTETVGSGFDFNTGIISTSPGQTTFDPSVGDTACPTGPNNASVIEAVRGSPMFQPATFDFGGTVVGNTQFVDALQRGAFWKALGEHRGDYHVMLSPVRYLPPVVIDVPAPYSTTLPAGFSPCGTLGLVDIDYLDAYLDQLVIPQLAQYGVSSSNLPVFVTHNVGYSIGDPTHLFDTCCALGYHSINSDTPPIQTYSVANYDTTGSFSQNADITTLAHELAEWANDPLINNRTPRWGHTGQVSGCQGNLEVGDPLSGTYSPPMAMDNGMTYHPQEEAFFSWFFGGPSVAVNGWYSNNGTFLNDAGRICK